MLYFIEGHGYQSPLLSSLSKSIIKVSQDKIEQSNIHFEKDDKIYIGSEEVLDILLQRFDNENSKKAIQLFKDKFQFREFLKPYFKKFYFQKIDVEDLDLLQLNFESHKKYIVKPTHGFFNVGVHILKAKTDLLELKTIIKNDLKSSAEVFSQSIISTHDLIIEQYIGTKKETDPLKMTNNLEIAVDMYYNSKGKPVILGIYHHPYPKNKAYFNVIYYTNHKLFQLYYKKIFYFFKTINSKSLKLTSFPIHAEFKIINKKIFPIEFNPYRFGGFGLADINYHAFQHNLYMHYFEDKEIDWEKTWNGNKNNYFCWVLGYNGTKMNPTRDMPNEKNFKQIIGKTQIAYHSLDYKKFPVFAMAYLKKTKKDELKKILNIDFNKLIFYKK